MNFMLFVLMSARPSGLEVFAGGVFIATIVFVIRIIWRIIVDKTSNKKKWDDVDKK